jgi:hypothetical protein
MSTTRTLAAKVVFVLGGLLSRVKTYQRVYSMNWEDPEDRPEFTPAGRRWISSRLSMQLLHLSEKIDPGHWEHWALDHEDCPSDVRCSRCGGQLCPDDEE